MTFLKLAIVGLVSAISISTANAQLIRTFVATYGADTNPCTPEAPCRTFPTAINATASGGTVIALDSGGYGSDVAITKSVTLTANPGNVAQIRSSSFGVRVNGVGISVSLDRLQITGSGNGVEFQNGGFVALSSTLIQTTGSYGVYHTAPANMTMYNVTLQAASNSCFLVTRAAGGLPASASITDSRSQDCIYGFAAVGNARVTIKNTSASGRSKAQSDCVANFVASYDGSTTPSMSLDEVQSSNCYRGLWANGDLIVANSTIAGNDLAASGGTSGKSYGNNRVHQNNTNALGFSSATQQ